MYIHLSFHFNAEVRGCNFEKAKAMVRSGKTRFDKDTAPVCSIPKALWFDDYRTQSSQINTETDEGRNVIVSRITLGRSCPQPLVGSCTCPDEQVVGKRVKCYSSLARQAYSATSNPRRRRKAAPVLAGQLYSEILLQSRRKIADIARSLTGSRVWTSANFMWPQQ
jgi:hypothetical protein